MNEDLENESFGTNWEISTPFTTAEGLTAVHTATYPSCCHEDSALFLAMLAVSLLGCFTLKYFQQVLMDFPATCLKVSMPFTCFCKHQNVTQRFISFMIQEKPSDPSDELFFFLFFIFYHLNFVELTLIQQNWFWYIFLVLFLFENY